MKPSSILSLSTLAAAAWICLPGEAGAIPLPDNSRRACPNYCLRIVNDNSEAGAIQGFALQGFGVLGESGNGDGLYGSSGAGNGVLGDSASGTGVVGFSRAESDGRGVIGKARRNGSGVYGEALNAVAGWAGHFDGRILAHDYREGPAPTGAQTAAYGVPHLLRLKPVAFRLKGDRAHQLRLGFVGPEVQAVIPEAVGTDRGRAPSLNQTELLPVLVRAVQEQQQMIRRGNDRLSALERSDKPLLSSLTGGAGGALALGLLPLGLLLAMRRKDRRVP
jgi:hypothetical protein